MRPLRALSVAAIILLAASAGAQVSEPSPHDPEAFDIMNVLAAHNLHALQNERWNAYGQLTYISSWKLPFAAAYSNLHGSSNSLSTAAERSYTGTVTLYAGVALWPGAELYAVPELITEKPLSHLVGLGGVIQNFELQKGGSETPLLYLSRAYFRQTIGVGGARHEKSSDPMQLGTTVDSRRFVLTVGNFSILDFFDKNAFAGDLRRQFFNMAFLTNAAYDFAADARGYAWGAILEYFHDDWAIRFGRITPPKNPNQLPLDFRFWLFYGDQVEVEHTHELWGRTGAIRLLGFRNHENSGRFDIAQAAYRGDPKKNATTCRGFHYASTNANAPDLCWARAPNDKFGVGLTMEQAVYDNVGFFLRGMISDGASEVYSYTATDSSLSLGLLAQGAAWYRPNDAMGVAFGQGWISQPHSQYLNAGGVDGFIGDGAIHAAPERVVDVFYSANVFGPVWLSGDYQHIDNPAYNADRGPVNIFGARVHAEL